MKPIRRVEGPSPVHASYSGRMFPTLELLIRAQDVEPIQKELVTQLENIYRGPGVIHGHEGTQ